MRTFRYKHISTTASASILGNQGTLATVVVNTAAASAVLTLYDGTDNTGTVIAVVDASVQGAKTYLVHFNTGLYYALAGGNADITVGYE